jgi:hypothetical protein
LTLAVLACLGLFLVVAAVTATAILATAAHVAIQALAALAEAAAVVGVAIMILAWISVLLAAQVFLQTPSWALPFAVAGKVAAYVLTEWVRN